MLSHFWDVFTWNGHVLMILKCSFSVFGMMNKVCRCCFLSTAWPQICFPCLLNWFLCFYQCVTPIGRRLLRSVCILESGALAIDICIMDLGSNSTVFIRSWFLRPILDIDNLNRRFNAVSLLKLCHFCYFI